MEFWGQEVKPGTKVSCEVSEGYVIHLSQAALGETKKGGENVVVSVKVGDKKLVLGTLSAEKHPQIMCDLIFDEDFELSHNSKTTSVFLLGYKSLVPDMFEEEDESDEEMLTDDIPEKKNAIEKPAAKVPVKDGKQDVESSDKETSSGEDFSGDSEDDSEDDSDDDSEDDDLSSGSDDFSDESEDEETPVKAELSKKRAADTALKTPASDKKAKIATPSGQKTGDKKGAQVATPHPAKQVSKTPADNKAKEKSNSKTPAAGKAKEKSPKSGSHACKSCSKTFGSPAALESHQKAKKHEA